MTDKCMLTDEENNQRKSLSTLLTNSLFYFILVGNRNVERGGKVQWLSVKGSGKL